MTDDPITYYEHYANKEALCLIEDYCAACEGMCNTPPEGQRPCDIFQLKQRMLSRTYKNIRPISELTEITDPIGPTHPTEEFLVCLREDEEFWKPENIDAFIDILRIVWWIPERHLIYDPAERTLTLFTGGWSGNEGIIEALQHTLFWMLYQKRGRTVGDYTFVFPEKEGDKS
jgi:hypothetical protein